MKILIIITISIAVLTLLFVLLCTIRLSGLISQEEEKRKDK